MDEREAGGSVEVTQLLTVAAKSQRPQSQPKLPLPSLLVARHRSPNTEGSLPEDSCPYRKKESLGSTGFEQFLPLLRISDRKRDGVESVLKLLGV